MKRSQIRPVTVAGDEAGETAPTGCTAPDEEAYMVTVLRLLPELCPHNVATVIEAASKQLQHQISEVERASNSIGSGADAMLDDILANIRQLPPAEQRKVAEGLALEERSLHVCTAKDAAHYLKCSVRTLPRWRKKAPRGFSFKIKGRRYYNVLLAPVSDKGKMDTTCPNESEL